MEFEKHDSKAGRPQAQPAGRAGAGRLLPNVFGRLVWALRRLRPNEAATSADAGIEHLTDARWQLADNQTRLRELLDCQTQLIVRRDADETIIFANRAFCDAFGVESENLLGRRFAPAVFATAAVAPEHAHRQTAVEQVQTSTGLRWIQWDKHRLISTAGRPEIQSVGRDVTDERRREAELREARDQADAANRAKSRFLAAMSHEIRTPMNGILGMASLLQETEQSEEQLSYTRAIDQSAKSLLALIDEILDFSKIEAGKLQLNEVPFSLRACVYSAIELMAPKAASRGNEISTAIGADVTDVVVGDAARVRQILLNLISNAVKFTEKGKIHVAVRPLQGEAPPMGSLFYEFEVSDTGIGFTADTMNLLFAEFEQAENIPGGRQSGTGLGLAISKRLARAMGGDIRADGELGKGATFTVVLKLTDAARGDIDRVEAGRHRLSYPSTLTLGDGNPPRVLIAEDNEINALLARRMCERFGCGAVVVKDGQDAVDAVAESLAAGARGFDVILMDVFMPRLDGLEATRIIKEKFASRNLPAFACPPIVALTANAFAEDRERCLAAGMDDYLAKPFDAAQLRALLARWLAPSVCRRAS